MIEFAAGIFVGSSIGAVIMGALLAHARTPALGARRPAAMQSHATLQVPRYAAPLSARHTTLAEALPALRRTHVAVAGSQPD